MSLIVHLISLADLLHRLMPIYYAVLGIMLLFYGSSPYVPLLGTMIGLYFLYGYDYFHTGIENADAPYMMLLGDVVCGLAFAALVHYNHGNYQRKFARHYKLVRRQGYRRPGYRRPASVPLSRSPAAREEERVPTYAEVLKS
ncbi:hypothetical protein MBM_06512 [Drepanopeziza brunnea f. sp. 'multigermtubi' MB_m1]|uniref:Uncharacterized protein n=2 Tax=Drepanopeziza brunnea f. sp. 'multigermtubi' TaxID=698441 RepID=K1WQL5_MARBU|nr:uncharacterized protein MBM_06512 [Drepanopeziza brunnea f. sp. 'multigermtubi' MB_m1]EKD15296.1 hypothetical protein MBM_06512 [Drepanopeziza brunnea f. sp. 'multigermtubi' MB_m1]